MVRLTIDGVNQLSTDFFHRAFGNVVECCPEAAVLVEKKRPFETTQQLISIFDTYLETLNSEGRTHVLTSHPDLAGKLADDGKLTEESTREQRCAGLNRLPPADKLRMNQLNSNYKEKFGFPFVICARENKAEAILNGLKTRLKNDSDMELQTGIDEVKKICKLRILELVDL